MTPTSDQRNQGQQWQRRADQLHQEEWATSQELLRVAKRLLRLHLVHEKPASLAQIERILNISARLASLAGVPAAQPPQASTELTAYIEEAKLAMQKTYADFAKNGVVPNVHDQINRERANFGQPIPSTPQQSPNQPPPPTPPQTPSQP